MRIINHKFVETPHGNTVVWRYMGLDKFLDLLVNNRLFFVNAGKLTDAYEISIPKKVLKEKKNEFRNMGLSGRELDEEIAAFEWENSPMKDLTLVNCWSIGRYESYALWKIYLSGSKAGVSIRSSISSLKKAITLGKDPVKEDIYIGKVQYADYIPERQINRFTLITTKRQFYAFENELRLFILHFPPSEGGTKPPYELGVGRHIKVDIDILIDKIYLSPFVGPWFRRTLERTVKEIRPSLLKKLVTSSIRDI